MANFFEPQLSKYSVLEATIMILCREMIPLLNHDKK